MQEKQHELPSSQHSPPPSTLGEMKDFTRDQSNLRLLKPKAAAILIYGGWGGGGGGRSQVMPGLRAKKNHLVLEGTVKMIIYPPTD